MAKLSEAVLETGRNHIRALDLDGFMTWVGTTGVAIDQDVLRSTFDKIFRAKSAETALRMFDAVFPKADPEADAQLKAAARKLGWGCLALLALLVVGATGGVSCIS